MSQLDFISDAPQQTLFKDIRNTRPSVAEEKAELCLRLRAMCIKPPPSVVNGSIQRTREWLAAQKDALALVKGTRATVPQLQSAITNMTRFL